MKMKEMLEKINDHEWLLPKTARKEMKAAGKVIANKVILDAMEDDTIGQLSNVCCLPGVVEPVCAMPDAHFGYGLPMGAVAAFDAKEGIISSGLCGFDINCGVNSIRTNLSYDEIRPKMKQLIDELFRAVPCGVGSKGKLRLSDEQLDEILVKGCRWAVLNGYGTKEDLENLEENGSMPGGDPSKVSDLAKKRGKPQLGTLGAGNHFLEIQKVTDAYSDTAGKWGIEKKGQILIMLHCGSRGLGHQVASDYLKIQEKAVRKYDIWLPDRQLACAPASSEEGQDYWKAMICAVNYSFVNRLVMTQWIREAFERVFNKPWKDMEMHTVYGICHNVVKKERHKVGGEEKELYVHRKGATRSFPGQPVLLAGSMGTASYILEGTKDAMEKSFGSSAHGAGRAMSRNAAISKFDGKKISEELLHHKGIITKATGWDSLAEEAPLAYKDIEAVIDSVDGSGISKKVVRVEPVGVLKG